ncbi:ABC transporter ATPase [Aureibaculum sp. 2210JD6-5]|uniref:ABC transporter ATPase n=1 Tax=Aureibaculum sp. 2210JD6-5 TaxID=3103957 RepID=UPI002AACB1D8|nr:ABC transporter ATPase [Aureibaculum sp. 2210JD6-5]MDY7395193.1 ABC transporter ATPase [Aureibaculum sp. 2210JD6-5]
MYVDFNALPNTSRVWVYQADRTLTEPEVKQISEYLRNFVNSWKRHGDDLTASYKIEYNQFIILAVDEDQNGVSGCSIDSSVHIIKEIEKAFDVDLLNKMKVSFKDGSNINTVNLSDFKKYAAQNKINADTIVFNNMINSKAELQSAWEVEASKSWHAKFLN